MANAFYPLCVCEDADKSTWGYHHIQEGVVYGKERKEQKKRVI